MPAGACCMALLCSVWWIRQISGCPALCCEWPFLLCAALCCTAWRHRTDGHYCRSVVGAGSARMAVRSRTARSAVAARSAHTVGKSRTARTVAAAASVCNVPSTHMLPPPRTRTRARAGTHGRRGSRCKDCGGSEICTHGRRRSRCKDCGGYGHNYIGLALQRLRRVRP